MPRDDTPLALVSDVTAALGLLSRLPVEVNHQAAQARSAASAWAYPIVGLILGALAVFAGLIAQLLGMPDLGIAAIILTTLIMLTGAMHEDGLADTADGFWGGYTQERRLEIMKDSHLGTYGTLALMISVLLRFGLIFMLVSQGSAWVLLAICALSRAPMVLIMSRMPAARRDGLSQQVGRPRIETALLAALIALCIGFVLMGGALVHGVLLAGLAVAGLAYCALNKIGGQTGDILGASQQLTEIAFLAAAVSAIA
jgi:adenosylcobinamide-GDP ribazoletransferase